MGKFHVNLSLGRWACMFANTLLSPQNPTVGDNCSGMKIDNSYCVEAAFEPTVPTKTTTTTPPKPTSTKPANGSSALISRRLKC